MASLTSSLISTGISENMETVLNEKRAKNPIVSAIVASSDTLTEQMTIAKADRDDMLEQVKMLVTSTAASLSKLTSIQEIIQEKQTVQAANVTITGSPDIASFFSSLLLMTSNDKRLARLSRIPTIISAIVTSITKFATIEPALKSFESANQHLSNLVVIGKQTGQAIMLIAGGIATLGLAIWSFGEVVNAGALLAVIGTIWALSQFTTLEKKTSKSLLLISAGIATLGLSIWAFSEVVGITDILTVTGTMIAILGTLALFDKLTNSRSLTRTSVALLITAGAIAVMSLTIREFEDISWESIGKAAAVIGGIGLSLAIVSKISSSRNMVGVAIGLLAVSGSLLALSYVLQEFDKVSLQSILTAGIAISGLSVAMFLVGKFAKHIVIGALTLAAASLSLMVLAEGLKSLSTIDLSLQDGARLLAIVGITSAVFGIIGIPSFAILVATGSVVVGLLSASLWALSKGLNALSTVSLTAEDGDRFKQSVRHVVDGLAYIAFVLNPIVGAAALASSLLITATVLPLTGAIGVLSLLRVPSSDQLDGFRTSIGAIVGSITSVSLVDAGKLLLISPILLATSVAAIGIGTAISIFSYLTTKPERVELAIGSIDMFVTGIASMFDKYGVKTFAKITMGIASLMSVGAMLKSMAEGVSAIGNLQFREYRVVNGKMVLVSSRSFTDDDFSRVGTSIARIVSAITEPLVAIGGSNDSITIAGMTITNPFGNKVKRGVNALSKLGSVFNPITDLLKVFASSKIDDKFVENFNRIIARLLAGVGSTFETLAKKHAAIDKTGGVSALFYNAEKMFKTLATSKYDAASYAFERIGKAFVTIKESVNGLDLERLSKLDGLMYHTMNIVNSESLSKLEALFDRLNSTLSNSNDRSTTETVNNTIIKSDSSKSIKSKKDDTSMNDKMIELISDGNQDVYQVLKQIKELLLSGTVIVKTKPVDAF